MIRPSSDWAQAPSARGLLWRAPGAELGYEERLTPALPFRRIIAAFVADLTHCHVDRQRMETLEGEVAAWACASGHLTDRPVQRCIGAVFADSFCTRLVLTTHSPDRFAMDREYSIALLRSTSLALGIRRQRCEYRPPASWTPLPSGLMTEWLAPGFPADGSHIIVYPANPSDHAPAEVLAALVRDHQPAAPAESITTATLTGTRWCVTGHDGGRPLFREIAVLSRSPYVYTLVLATRDGVRHHQHLPAFLSVVESVVPVRAGTPLRERATIGDFWA
jgi:hypothetical protein